MQPEVRHIVALGAAYWPRDGVPITGSINGDGIARLTEALRLRREFGIERLVLSGGRATSVAPSAEGYARLASALGTDRASMVLLDKPNDTAEEAAAVKALLGDQPFILVTSAYHMPRAMKLMERVGAHAIPAPAGHRGATPGGLPGSGWLPGASSLGKTEAALHEYAGLLALAVGVQ
jgi:uncharacterized SAM-binding protein YcdF (DUF218 family)